MSPSPPPEKIIIYDDPHINFAHGGSADFRGKHNTVFNLLSHKNLSVNARFADAKYRDGERLITGTYMVDAFVTVVTDNGWQLRIALYAGAKKVDHVEMAWHLPSTGALARSRNLTFVHADTYAMEGDVQVQFNPPSPKEFKSGAGPTMIVTQKGRWRVQVATQKYYDEIDSVATKAEPIKKFRVDVEVQPLDPKVEKDAVAPHGIIGQSFDGDEIGVSGKNDDYSKEGEIVTTAQAEGSIEGTWTDYVMSAPFATDFKYSRYDVKAAKPRNLDKLTGARSVRKSSNAPSKIWARAR